MAHAGGGRLSADHPLVSYCDGGTVHLRLSPCESLFLTTAEAIRLAEQVRQDLVCRTAAQADQPVMVADVPVTAAEAWRLVEALQQLQPGDSGPAHGLWEWITEGF